jgi:hypothetical protein
MSLQQLKPENGGFSEVCLIRLPMAGGDAQATEKERTWPGRELMMVRDACAVAHSLFNGLDFRYF